MTKIRKGKKKLEELAQIDGKTAEEKPRPRTLDQLWGETSDLKYNTTDVDEYRESLAQMNLSDMQANAVKVGLLPHENRTILAERMVREFKKHVVAYEPVPISRKHPKISKEVEKILAEGR